MSKVMLWRVLREHEGDKPYREGDVREGTEAELGHLAPKVLELLGPAEAKSEDPPLNKLEKTASANKAKSGRKTKA